MPRLFIAFVRRQWHALRSPLFAAMAICLLASAALPSIARADDSYPNRPIRIIIPYAPGGGADAVIRYMSDKLTENLGQQIIIENRPGASGFIGAQVVAMAPPDGYVLLMGFDGGIVVAPHLIKAPFDPLKDFVPVTKINDATLVLAANANLPVKTLKDLVEYAKTRPDGVEFGSSGQGTTTHLAGELLALRTGMKMQHVPYKGGGQAVTDTVAGQIPLIFTVAPTIMSYLKQGRLTAIAVASAERSPNLPEVPTIAESGYPGYAVASWYGIFAPAKTPKAVVDRIQKAVFDVQQIPEVRERYLKAAFEPSGMASDAFAKVVREDYERWGKVVKEGNIKLE